MKRNEKYKCKYDGNWLQNSHEGYICPECGTIYQEISTEVKEYITDDEGNIFPISDTILIEKAD